MCVIMQKFVAIGQTVAKIWRFFKTAAVRHLVFSKKIRNFDRSKAYKKVKMRHYIKFS